MKIFYQFSILTLLQVISLAQYKELYIQNNPSGNNLNGGSDTNTTALVSGSNGGWNSGTGVYTFSSAKNLSGVTTNMTAAVFVDGATTNNFIGCISAIDDGADTVTLSIVNKIGTIPTTGASGISINIGGALYGPTNNYSFPFGWATATLTNNHTPMRWNIRGGSDYIITEPVQHTFGGPMVWEGYTNSPGDGGIAKFYGNTNTYVVWQLFSFSSAGQRLKRLHFDGSLMRPGAGTATNQMVNITGRTEIDECVFNGSWRTALRMAAISSSVRRSLFYDNERDTANGTGTIQFIVAAVAQDNVILDSAQDGTGVLDASGILSANGSSDLTVIEGNILVNVYGAAIEHAANSGAVIIRGNTVIGAYETAIKISSSVTGITNQSMFIIENNLIVNSGFGIRGRPGSALTPMMSGPYLRNNAFFNITNLPYTTNINSSFVTGEIILTGNPFVSGTYNLNNTIGAGAAVRNAGSGAFLWLTNTSPITISYPDIGAIQNLSRGSSATMSGSAMLK